MADSSGSSFIEKLNAGTSLFNVLVTLAIAVGGYKWVTQPQQQSDSAHRQTTDIIEVAKFFNDIRPNINFTCIANQDGPVTAVVNCTEKNIGGQRILLDMPDVKLRRTDQDGFIDTKYYKITQSNANTLPVGASGTTNYRIEVPGSSSVDWSKIIVVTNEYVRTDPDVLATLAGKLDSDVDEQQLSKLSVQSFGYMSPVTLISSPAPIQPPAVPTLPASDAQAQ